MHRSVFLLKRAHFAIRKAMDSQLAEYHLTAAQLEVLGPVVSHEGAGLEHRTLLEWLEVSSPTLTNMIDGLVERGLIERRISSEDARVKLLTATPSGRELWQSLESMQDEFFNKFFRGVSNGEKVLLTDILERIITNAGDVCQNK